jgi:hypothetical protein
MPKENPLRQPPVKKRKVFYVMGFDPRGTNFYHTQLKREARISERRGFSTLRVGQLDAISMHGDECQCQSSLNGHNLEISYEFLSITDIVTNYFNLPLAQRIFQAIRLFYQGIMSGFFVKQFLHAPTFALFTLYPFVMLALGLVFGVLAGIVANEVSNNLIVATAIFLLTLIGSMGLLIRNENRFYVFYLLGDFLFSCTAITTTQATLQDRLDSFATHIANILRESNEDEEILIVGHSSGALLAIQVAASIIRLSPPEPVRRFSLLTLGNQASLVYFQGTDRFRNDITQLVDAAELTWHDVFAPQDVISSGRFDLIKHLKQVRPESSGYHLSSARLKEALTPTTYRKIRHSFLKLHMQYLRASETGHGFNYFSMLESPSRLGETQF